MVLDRAFGEVEAIGDFLVRGAAAEQGDDFALAGREGQNQGFGLRAARLHQAREGGNHAAGDGTLQGNSPRVAAWIAETSVSDDSPSTDIRRRRLSARRTDSHRHRTW